MSKREQPDQAWKEHELGQEIERRKEGSSRTIAPETPESNTLPSKARTPSPTLTVKLQADGSIPSPLEKKSYYREK